MAVYTVTMEPVTPSPATADLPFSRYTLADIQEACRQHRLGALRWRVNNDGTPHDGIGRIYVAMPNPQLDLVIQTDGNGAANRCHAFPATNWHHIDQPMQQEMQLLFQSIARAKTLFLKDGINDPLTITTKRGVTAYGIKDRIINLETHTSHATALLQAKRIAFTEYMARIEPLAARIEALAPESTHPQSMRTLSHQLRASTDLLSEYLPRLDHLQKINHEEKTHLTRAAQICSTGNTGLAETYLRNNYPDDIADHRKGIQADRQFADRMYGMFGGIECAVDDVRHHLGLAPEPLVEAMHRTITQTQQAYCRADADVQLKATLDAVDALHRVYPTEAAAGRPGNGIRVVYAQREGTLHDPEITKGPDR